MSEIIKEPLSPCKDCDKRHFKCHSECHEYIQYKKDREIYLEIKAKAMKKYHEAIAYDQQKRRNRR
ncbi:MAG: hypothetical protein J6P97_00950 [Bacteroidales bacterium]|nr:hypothetical protein [Bacteroidales bacterium]